MQTLKRSAMDITQDILPLSDFNEQSRVLRERAKETHNPILLTVDGRVEWVVQDAASYQRMQALIERMEALDGIDRGLASMEAGEGTSADEFFGWMEARHAFLRES